MVKNEYLNVKDCPFCNIWVEGNLPKKVFHLSERFMIFEHDTLHLPIVVFREHVTNINKEDWGRILQKCRQLYGWGMRLLIMEGRGLPKDHWYAIIKSGRVIY